jgi:hypothetical protein
MSNKEEGLSIVAVTLGFTEAVCVSVEGKFLNTQLHSNVEEIGGGGLIDFYYMLAEFAGWSWKLAEAIWALDHDCFVGVYAYEVEEVFGAKLAEMMSTTSDIGEQQVLRMLGEVAYDYFNSAYAKPMSQEIADAITKHTKFIK